VSGFVREEHEKGSVYFTTHILAETDRLELLLYHQSNIHSHGKTQFE